MSLVLLFCLPFTQPELNLYAQGAVPKGNATKEYMESLQLKPGEVIYKCPKCCCIKPERAHHCRYSLCSSRAQPRSSTQSAPVVCGSLQTGPFPVAGNKWITAKGSDKVSTYFPGLVAMGWHMNFVTRENRPLYGCCPSCLTGAADEMQAPVDIHAV